MESWAQYVRRVAGVLTQAEIADKIGVAQTNVSRWLRGDPGLPKAESVIAFARAFRQPPGEALLAAGYISADEAQNFGTRTPLSQYSLDELFAEIQSRIKD